METRDSVDTHAGATKFIGRLGAVRQAKATAALDAAQPIAAAAGALTSIALAMQHDAAAVAAVEA
jgi:hypothetical protein